MTNMDLRGVQGLSREEATRRLSAEGYNELPRARKHSLISTIISVMREPMILLLVVAGSLYFLLGDVAEALLLLASIFLIVGINLYQERRTERALEALRDLSSPRALVIRDGERLRIAGREVVHGDALVLTEGDRVPADALVLASLNLSIDESLLTGESLPVDKVAGISGMSMAAPGGNAESFVFSGTLVVRGQGVAEVLATGAATALGRIGKSLQSAPSEQTQVQQETRRIVQRLAIGALSLCLLVSVVQGLTNGWDNGLLTGITLAMAIIPEEFPVVLTVFLALGAWRLSRQQVLVRQVPMVEALGAATVLCVDKTGTLTLNQMSVRTLVAGGQSYNAASLPAPLPDELRELVEFSALASQRDPFDPMERAINDLAVRLVPSTELPHDNWQLVREYALSSKLLALSHVWRSPAQGEYVVAAKGAPEAIWNLCHTNTEQTKALAGLVEAMAEDGLRVLGVAKAYFQESTLPGEPHDFDFAFLGFVGLADPVRPSVPGAIQECYTAGIRVVMITGDYAGTARHVAIEAGLRLEGDVMNGPELDDLTDTELQQRARQVNIFARIVPEQKLRLVNALKANGEIVAMTGDGVNDAPALKAAHIGIAMGGRGSDVAREAAGLVILDDDFSSIVRAVRLGRGIFDNLRKAMTYLLAVHMPIAGLSLIPVLLQTPLVLMPAHVLFLELIIDPACSVAFEAEPTRADVMTRPPRPVAEPLFSSSAVGLSLLQGGSALLVVLAVYVITWSNGHNELEARAMTFTTLVATNLALILSNRSWSRSILATMRMSNAPFWYVIGGAAILLILVLFVPYLQDLFHFAQLQPRQLAISLAAGGVALIWFEVLKLIRGDPVTP